MHFIIIPNSIQYTLPISNKLKKQPTEGWDFFI